MRNFLTICSFLLIAVMPLKSYAAEAPALYAVAFHADWCGSCKVLGSNVVKARGKSDLDSQNVLFVKLDLTNKATRDQSSLMASALGIKDFYEENNGKTGFVLLVNSKTGEAVGKLTKDMDSGQITTMIQEKISMIATS